MRPSLQIPAVLSLVLLSNCSTPSNLTLPPSNNTQAVSARDKQEYGESVLYNFSSPGYGPNYVSPLTPDGQGDYFGTTAVGGTGHGTVYELMPNGKGRWKESTLYSFSGLADGGGPIFTPLIVKKSGDLYGITHNGGVNDRGVVYEMQRSGQSWNERVVYDFGSAGSPGVWPFAFIADSKGNFFGAVNLIDHQGNWAEGVFELTPSSGGWQAALIFDDDINSSTSGGGGLAIDAKENVFGITSIALKPSEVFELSPSSRGWKSKILYTFARIDLDPEAPPVLDKSDNIYGATVAGGPANDGTIFELKPSDNGAWTSRTLHAFKGGPSDGAAPYASITFDRRGNIYGTTSVGGAHRGCNGVYDTGCGTVYELTPSGGRYESKLLWSFDGKDGSQPFAGVVLDGGGHVFGTTTQGGSPACYAKAGCGNAFEIK